MVADDTGVVFIPRDQIMAVLELCEKKKQAEDTRIDAISKGVPVPVFYAQGIARTCAVTGSDDEPALAQNRRRRRRRASAATFGGMLARAGMDVTLIGRQRHVDAINRDGLLFQSGDAEERIAVAATTDIAAVGGADLILFCVKYLDTEDAAAKMAPHLAPDAVILSLQNGVDNAERIRVHVKQPGRAGAGLCRGEYPGPGTRAAHRRRPPDHRAIGRFRGRDADGRLLDEIAALVYAAPGSPVRISDDIEADLWTKLVMNCAYNAICALCGAPYGRMVASPEVRGVMREVVAEVVLVARAKGVELPGDIADRAIKFADAMPQTMSSTAQDIAKGRRTEIDHLNGYVARQGEALGIPTPVNRTLSALMKLLEQTRSASSGSSEDYSLGWMFAALPTSSHFLISARTNKAKSAGLLAIGSAPSPVIIALVLGSANITAASAARRSTIGCGVPAGANMPNQFSTS